jgi:CDP-diacylglycerol--glycerol-3-phosphate 3-phosphatidyltransferase
MFKNKEIYTKSNLLSLFRLFLSIPIWFLLDNFHVESARYITAFICLVAIVTDFLDGYLARKLNEVTEAGKIIDPLADKIVVGIVALKLYLIGELPSYYFFMIVGRDVLIFTGGILLSLKIKKVLPSNMLGKITVTVLGIVLLMIIINVKKDNLLYLTFYIASMLLILGSLAGYIIRSVEFLKQKNYESI